jgi:hypothetical protein
VGLVLKKKLDFPLLTGFLINGIFAGARRHAVCNGLILMWS